MEDKYFKLLQKNVGNDVKIVSSLAGGMMNEAYVVESSKGKFVYYISTAQANEMVDRKLEKETQNIAFDLGITSENVYFDLENGIKINRYIEGKSINNVNKFDYTKVAKLMIKFHSSKKQASTYYDPLNRLLNFKKEAEKLNKKIKEKEKEIENLNSEIEKLKAQRAKEVSKINEELVKRNLQVIGNSLE